MTFWIVNPFDNLPPEGLRPQRYWLMARAFAQAGHTVVYWSADFSHAYKRARDVAALEGRYEGFELRLVHEPPYPKNICLRRLWSHWRFARNWLAAARAEVKGPRGFRGFKGLMGFGGFKGLMGQRPDVLIVSSPPLALGAAARAFCRSTGAKLVIDIQDAWPETFQRVVPRFLLLPLAMLARRNYRAADAITAVSRRYLVLARTYGADCPRHLCYHGIARSREPSTPNPPTHQLTNPPTHQLTNLPTRQPTNSPTYRLAYIGNMSLSYDLATVVAVVRERTDLSLDLAGAGPDEAALKAQAADCDRIRFHGYLDEIALRELLLQSDAGIIPMFPESQVGIPGKLADYAAAGLPVVSSLLGETLDLLVRHCAGVPYVAGDRDSFSVAVDKVRHLEKKGLHALAVEFDAEKLYNSYLNFVLEKV